MHVKMVDFVLLINVLYCMEREGFKQHKRKDRNRPMSRFIVISLFMRGTLANESGAISMLTHSITSAGLRSSAILNCLVKLTKNEKCILFIIYIYLYI